MSNGIKISVDGEVFEGEIFDTTTGRAVYEALPIESGINTWGDEFYFNAGLHLGRDETSTMDVDVGDLGYWPDGDALCIFFGPTPASVGDRPVPASEVNILGRVEDAVKFRNLIGAKKIIISG